jgi:hypothetical protein
MGLAASKYRAIPRFLADRGRIASAVSAQDVDPAYSAPR